MSDDATGLLRGVDVSSYEGPPADWKAGAGAIAWAAVKITELQPGGTRYVNPDAAADWAFLHGKGRIGYLFGHPATDPAATAEFFARELRALGLDPGDGIALDLEVTDGKTAAEVSAWAHAVLGELGWRIERTPLVYTFESFAQAGNCAGLGRYPLWIADPSDPAGHPAVPPPWTRWTIQQTGITGSIDRDVAAFASLADMAAALGRKLPGVEQVVPADAWTRLDGTNAEVLITGVTALRVRKAG